MGRGSSPGNLTGCLQGPGDRKGWCPSGWHRSHGHLRPLESAHTPVWTGKETEAQEDGDSSKVRQQVPVGLGPGHGLRQPDPHLGSWGEPGASPRTHHTLPRRSQVAGGCKGTQGLSLNDHSQGSTGVRSPRRDRWGGCKGWTSSPDTENQAHGELGKWRARAPLLTRPLSESIWVFAVDPPLRGWPASDLPLDSCPTRRGACTVQEGNPLPVLLASTSLLLQTPMP